MKEKNNLVTKRAFTLIEVLVTIAIIAVLMTLSLAALAGVRKISRDGKRKADLEQIRAALEIYRTDCKTYPDSVPTDGSSLTGVEASCVGNVYMESVPKDPASCIYSYAKSSANAYVLCASLEVGGGTVVGCGSCGTSCTCNYKVINP